MGGENCALPDCTASRSYCRGLTFHKIPKKGLSAPKDEWREKLLLKINREDPWFTEEKKKIDANIFICSRHFKPDCFKTGGGSKPRRFLIPDSLPTEFMPAKSIEVPKLPERKEPHFVDGAPSERYPDPVFAGKANSSNVDQSTQLSMKPSRPPQAERPSPCSEPPKKRVRKVLAGSDHDIVQDTDESTELTSSTAQAGVPAPMWYRAHPDWVPTVNMYLASKQPADAVRTHAGVCSAVSCPNTRKKKICSQKSFFLFPKEEERCRQWVENLQREDLLHLSPSVFYTRKYLLCSDHFQENQFVHNTDRTRLIHDAIPTVFTRPEESMESSVNESDEDLDSSLGLEDIRPILEEGSLWPSTDHTYCSPSLVKENLEKPNGHKTDARRQKSGSGEEKTTWSATDKREGLGSKTKAKKPQKVPKNDAKKSNLCVKIKDKEKTEVCCAVGCRTGHHKSNKSLFVFPVHKARCIEWLQNLERQDLQEKSPHQLRCEGYRVCSDHFDPKHIVHVRQRPQLTRSAVPTLLKCWKRQTQKGRPAEGQRHQPSAKQKKNKCRGQAKEHPDSDLLQIKVEIDWAEDPLLHCSTQVLTDPETREEHMVLPRVDHTDFSTSSTSAILNNIKSEPVEEGEEMEHIKLEPVEEEERLCGDNHESLDLPRHRSAGCGQANSVDNGNQSRLQVCVSDIKSEPDSDNMEESHWIQSLHHPASNIKLEPDGDDVAELGRIQSVHHTCSGRINSVEQFSCNSKLTGWKQICSSDEQIHTKPYHTYSKSTASRHGMDSGEHIDNIEQYGGNGTMTFASRLIEENDVEMSYTVVKMEPESDMEEV